MPNGLRNDLEYSARRKHRAREELQGATRICSEICRPELLHSNIEVPVYRRAVATIDRQYLKDTPGSQDTDLLRRERRRDIFHEDFHDRERQD